MACIFSETYLYFSLIDFLQRDWISPSNNSLLRESADSKLKILGSSSEAYVIIEALKDLPVMYGGMEIDF